VVTGPTDQGNGAGENPHAPLDALGRRITDMERHPSVVAPKTKARSAGDSAAFGRAFKLSTEFVAAVVIGGGMGYLGDRVFGTIE
jgi:ATP synthase protein I